MATRLRQRLAEKLPAEVLGGVFNSYDIIGDIAVIRLTEVSEKYSKDIAEAMMKAHSNVRTVLAQTSAVKGEFRIRELRLLAGEDKTITTHNESGCKFRVDLAKAYFSPRLSYERMRIARLVKPEETVVNMFAGVGCYSIIIAKHSDASRVYSVDLNPEAVLLMQENVRLNRVFGRVIPMLNDARDAVRTRLPHTADRVLMPLPERALEYLPDAVLALGKGRTWIHCYVFEHAGAGEEPVEKALLRVKEKLESLHLPFEVSYGRIVRATGPKWFQVVLDIQIAC